MSSAFCVFLSKRKEAKVGHKNPQTQETFSQFHSEVLPFKSRV